MNRLPRLTTPLLALSLAACSIGVDKVDTTIYAPVPTVGADPAWPSVRWQLGTSRPTAPRMLDSVRIVVSPTPGELQVYKGAMWWKSPTEMLEDSVLRLLEDSGKIPAVARQGSGIGADYRLLMDVRRFDADYAGASVPAAVVEVSAKLLHAQDQAVVDSHVFRHAAPAADAQLPAVNQAFGDALGTTAREIAGWALATGQAHERGHPSATP